MSSKLHPCQKCGACCAKFRVSFHWSETLGASHGVPSDWTVPVDGNMLAMKGSAEPPHRCSALEGDLGKNVTCRIYDHRPSPCRDFQASYERGTRDERCEKVRAHFGFAPLSPADWV